MAQARRGQAQHRPGRRFLGQIEPQEGKFDFSVLDGIIRDARSHNLRLALLWFGSWKNSWSSYPPDWVKKDFERFPRVQIAGGKSIELLSPFSDANRDADAHAFAALMRHVKEVDGQQHTVLMIQVENEIGMPSEPGSPATARPWPIRLRGAGAEGVDGLPPAAQGQPDSGAAPGVGGGRLQDNGTWEEVFGKSTATDEIFMAWHYCALHRPGGRGGQSRIPDTDVRERGLGWPGSAPWKKAVS
jgi:beta-galactosidase GanA